MAAKKEAYYKSPAGSQVERTEQNGVITADKGLLRYARSVTVKVINASPILTEREKAILREAS
ncbi:MAG: hypothetical protein KKE29_12820 [Proteobacteria bacterium]|nr:hypothetical protein [Pseudomonadota bacterium]MBU4576443.1 hypothetical protein [Pseudomonadota bacterium]MBU4599084.1 hypothetical protein [Pseudomonadota bacterium]MBV1714863.1 hypothetical protein [Desulfarculus sp.]MBV1753143.1 hypothetical protein [Desulfarculus sp.]